MESPYIPSLCSPHQLFHGKSSEDRSRVRLEGSARASKDASKIFEALLKPSIATVTADLAAMLFRRVGKALRRTSPHGFGLAALDAEQESNAGVASHHEHTVYAVAIPL